MFGKLPAADRLEAVFQEDDIQRRNGGVENARAVHRIKRHEKVEQHAKHVHLGNTDVVLGVRFELVQEPQWHAYKLAVLTTNTKDNLRFLHVLIFKLVQ